MRPLRALLVALVALAPCLTAQHVTYQQFTEKLSEAIRLGDEKGYDRAIKESPQYAVLYHRDHARAQLRKPDDAALEATLQRMRDGWSRAFGTETMDRVERWVQSLDQGDFRKFDQVYNAVNDAHNQLAQLRKDDIRERARFEHLRDQVMNMAEMFQTYGECYQAADAWGLVASIYAAMPDKTLTDRKDAVFAIEQFLDFRDRWKMTKDRFYIQNAGWAKSEKERLHADEKAAEQRAAEGYGDDIKGAEAYLVVDADSKEQTAPLTFKVVAKPRSTDMSMEGGPVPLRWPNIEVSGKGPVHLTKFQAAEIYLVRPAVNKFGISKMGTEDALEKGNHQLISPANKLRKPTILELGDGENYAMWFYEASNAEPFQGMNQNYQPVPDRAVLYYKSASSWVAEIGGEKVAFYDDNSNGKLFEEDPLAAGAFLRTLTGDPNDETKVPVYDSMQIGKEKPQVFSQWVEVGDAWYHLRRKDDGSIGIRPTNPEYFKTGSVELDWDAPKSTKMDVLIIQGKGDFETARYDLSHGKSMNVPAGLYTIQYGRIVSGKGARTMTADIFPGATGEIEVKPGETAKVKLGGTFKLDCVVERDGRDVTINTLTVKVLGEAGEHYANINGAVPEAEVLSSRDESGRGAKSIGELVPFSDPDFANAVSSHNTQLGWSVAFFPHVKGADAENAMRFKGFAEPDHKIGLSEDKNKLFGKLVPVFH